MKTICHAFNETRLIDPAHTAIRYCRKGQWRHYTWPQYFSIAEKLAAGLDHFGIKQGDRVAIASNTRWEWAAFDMAVLGLGAITVPIYHSASKEDFQFILQNSEANCLILENKVQLRAWKECSDCCPNIKTVILLEGETDQEGILSFSEMLTQGQEVIVDRPEFFIRENNKREETDTATILYTSGTTGTPKGVVLTHSQINSEIQDVFGVLGLTSEDVSLSFLPFAHILGRMELWGHIYQQFTMCYAQGIEKIVDNIKEIRPTFLVAVPRIFEKIYAASLTQAESNRSKYKVFSWARSIGKQISNNIMNHKPSSLALVAQYEIAKKAVFNEINKRLGGRIRVAFSGGAPLSAEIAEFFHGLGILILEGYGLTETTGAICVNTPFDFQFGTVGKPLGDVKIKLDKDGEILVKSQKVMIGYYKNEEANQNVFTNGFFRTGDIGEWTSSGHLKITDRKKDLIKTAGGKYVAPQKLEGLFKDNRYISHTLIHGDKRKYIVALFTLNFLAIEEYAKSKNISYQNREALSQDPRVRSLIRSFVAQANTQLASFETIKNFAILPKDFNIDSGELTPSLKVKRKVCDQRYKEILDRLYGIDPKKSKSKPSESPASKQN